MITYIDGPEVKITENDGIFVFLSREFINFYNFADGAENRN